MDEEMILGPHGDIVRACWDDLPRHYGHLVLDAFVIMPNHVHCVIVLADLAPVGAGLKPAPTTPPDRRQPLPEIVRALKTFSARRINALRGTPGTPVWQRNYYEHVVRDDAELERVRRYIVDNPRLWDDDEYHAGRRR